MKRVLKSRGVQSLLGIAVSLALLAWLGWDLDWQLFIDEFKKVNYLLLIPLTVLLFIHYILRAWRWRFFLEADCSLKSLYDALAIGNLATYILPLRAGEFVRPFILARDYKLSFPKTFASIVIERFFDLLCVLLTFAFIIPHIPTLPDWVYKGAVILSFIAFALLVFILAGIFLPQLLIKVLALCLWPVPNILGDKINGIALQFISGTSILRDPRRLIAVLLLSALVWISNYIFMYYSLFLVDIDQDLFLALTTAVVTALAVAAPSAPGFIGVIQVACVASFALYGINKEIATTFAVVLHAHQYVFIVPYGLLILSMKGLKLSSLREAKEL